MARAEIKTINGVECLLSESEAIVILGLQDGRNPARTLRNLVRSGQLARVAVHRNVWAFTAAELRRFIAHRIAR